MEGYEAADIWNLNETGCFYEAKSDFNGWEKGKQQLTIAFIAYVAGEKEASIVMVTSLQPRCLREY